MVPEQRERGDRRAGPERPLGGDDDHLSGVVRGSGGRIKAAVRYPEMLIWQGFSCTAADGARSLTHREADQYANPRHLWAPQPTVLADQSGGVTFKLYRRSLNLP